MELRHLRYFVAVAEELHFGRAANRLCMAEPPLSLQIRQLEQELGVELFTREGRRIRLTAAGEGFLEEARGILERVDHAARRAQLIDQGKVGRLAVGFTASTIYDVLPSVLRRFREENPNVDLELSELSSVEQWQALRKKRIDVGFVRLSRAEQGVVFEHLRSDPLVVALPSDDPLSSRKTLCFGELAGEPFVLYPRDSELHYTRWWLDLCANGGFAPQVVQKTGEVQTAMSLVAAGVGVAVVPSSMRNTHRDGVVYCSLTKPVPTVELVMGYRDNDPSPILTRFLNIVREAVQNSAVPVGQPYSSRVKSS